MIVFQLYVSFAIDKTILYSHLDAVAEQDSYELVRLTSNNERALCVSQQLPRIKMSTTEGKDWSHSLTKSKIRRVVRSLFAWMMYSMASNF